MNYEYLSNQPHRLVVRMPNWLGDAVMATPVLYDLKKKWPQIYMTVLCHKAIAFLLEKNPYIDEILVFSQAQGIEKSHERKRIIHEIKAKAFDTGILMTNSFSSAWWFFRGNVKRRIGYRSPFRGLFLTDPLELPLEYERQHLVISYKQILAPLGINISSTNPMLFISSEERLNIKKKLQDAGVSDNSILIGINPGAAYGSAKCWLPERFQQLTQYLVKSSAIRVLYFGDAQTKSLVDSICDDFHSQVINFAGKTSIRELIASINECTLFITNDSGPMHIAAALKKPLIALFGSTSEIKTGPYGGGKIIHNHVSCSPCYRRECPIDFRCMTSITVEDVIQQIDELLAKHQISLKNRQNS